MTTTEPSQPSELVPSTHADAGSGAQVRGWVTICAVERMLAGRGVTALVAGQPVAVFLLEDGSVAALDDRDPFSGACVLSRGIVGDAAGRPTVASPVYKQRFDLRTGRCLDDDTVSVRAWPARIKAGQIEIGVL